MMASVVTQTLKHFRINLASIGYFVLDNASNNDSTIDAIAREMGFNAAYRRLCCGLYTLNLIGQILL
jgi:hypothetical protein